MITISKNESSSRLETSTNCVKIHGIKIDCAARENCLEIN